MIAAELDTFPWGSALTLDESHSDSAEPSYVTIGPLRHGLWVIVWHFDGPDIHLIGARRATQREERKYEDRRERT
ncbi:BrnT family toxin [Xinfangfangia sp. D13-10-4-6]|nr:BrnT family toxin [Pseudogemmobacter hezensis]